MGENVFVELSIVIILAVTISYIMKMLKQPLIIGYIIVGILVSVTGIIHASSEMMTLSQIGVAILLFMVGLNLNPKIVKDVGKVSLITGVGQVIFTSLIGFGLCFLLGFDSMTSMYIAVAITFSSTIIIMKLLSDKADLDTLYGKISIGFLIVQDIIAMTILMIVSFSDGGTSTAIGMTILKGVGLVGGSIIVGVYILPKMIKKIAESQEFLELFSIGRCLLLASLFYVAGFSIEIGALIAGVTLSLSPYRFEISSKMKSLRDFFIVIFFVLFGTHMSIGDVGSQIVPIISLSLFILVGNPLIVLILMGRLGYTKKTAFKAGLTVAQVSEFSFILIMLGTSIGHIKGEILSLISIVGLITIAGSTYFILYSDQIYNYLEKYLSVFERKTIKENKQTKNLTQEVFIFGYNKVSLDIPKTLDEIEKTYLIIDYNPETVHYLKERNMDCLYGDASDLEFLNELPKSSAKMIISSIKDLETNMLLIHKFKEHGKNCIIITTAQGIDDAMKMYNAGASYVIVPHLIGGIHLSGIIKENQTDVGKFLDNKQVSIQRIEEIKVYKSMKVNKELILETLLTQPKK